VVHSVGVAKIPAVLALYAPNREKVVPMKFFYGCAYMMLFRRVGACCFLQIYGLVGWLRKVHETILSEFVKRHFFVYVAPYLSPQCGEMAFPRGVLIVIHKSEKASEFKIFTKKLLC
jgi:hypothetical protein